MLSLNILRMSEFAKFDVQFHSIQVKARLDPFILFFFFFVNRKNLQLSSGQSLGEGLTHY